MGDLSLTTDTLDPDDRAELARLVAANDASLLYDATGPGAESRQRLFARGLLDGRRGRILTPLGAMVVAALQDEIRAPAL